MSAGVATFDYDEDGLIDIYFPNGAALPGVRYDPPPRHALYKNLGGWRFRDVSVQAGIACTAFGLGIAVADFDNDGWPDIYLDNFGPNLLYHNNGDGTFTDVTRRAGVPGTTACGLLEKKVGAGACFFDIDGDGLLRPLRRELYRDRPGLLRHADEGQVRIHPVTDGVRPAAEHTLPKQRRRHLCRREQHLRYRRQPGPLDGRYLGRL